MVTRALYYDDIALTPAYSKLLSRKNANTSCVLGSKTFKLPVIPANMKCVIDDSIAQWLSNNDYFYIMHRFDNDVFEFVKRANIDNWSVVSISVGVKKCDYDLIEKLASSGYRVDYITIDIAHGHSLLMQQMIGHIKKHLPAAYIIAGNVCTADGFDDLASWGADAIKVGVGPGAACTTKLKTGFTYPMFSCVQNIRDNATFYGDHVLIADGGVSHNGDIAKAIVAGADWVMCGKLFSECLDSPAPVLNGRKLYYGSASVHNKHHNNNVEGKLVEVECNGQTFEAKLDEITQDLQSSISYAGGDSLNSLKTVKYILLK